MEKNDQTNSNYEVSFSVLIMSVASSAAMAMGLSPDPNSHEEKLDLPMAKFNIDLLEVIKEKTKNNLTGDEDNLLSLMISDLQMKYVQLK